MASSTPQIGSTRSTGAGYIASRLDDEGFSTDKVKELVKLAVERQQDTTTRLKKCKIGQICQGPRHLPHIERNDWYNPRGATGYQVCVILDGQAAANVLESGISNKDCHYRWPGNFTTSGALPIDHVHRGRASRVKDGRYVCIDFGKRHKYVFHSVENYNDGDPLKFIEVVSGRPGTEPSYHLNTPQKMQKAADLEALEASREEAAEAVPMATAMLQQVSIITTRLNEELECASTAIIKCKELAATLQYNPMSDDTEQERCEASRRVTEDLASWRNDLERRDAGTGSDAGEDNEERTGNDETRSSSVNSACIHRGICSRLPMLEEKRKLLVFLPDEYYANRDDLRQFCKPIEGFEWFSAASDLYVHLDGDNLDWIGNDLDIDERFFQHLCLTLVAEEEYYNQALDNVNGEGDDAEDWKANLGWVMPLVE